MKKIILIFTLIISNILFHLTFSMDNEKEISKQVQELFDAIDDIDIKKTKELIALGADVNCKDKSGTPLLMRASFRGDNAEIIKLLIDTGAKINAKDKNKKTALSYASESNYKEIMTLLISLGADTNNEDYKNNILSWELIDSINNNNIEKVKELIKVGVNVKDEFKIDFGRNYYGLHPLVIAAEKGQKEIVQLLIEAGADVNSKNKYGTTALHEACRKGYLDIFYYLIKSAANINQLDCESRGAFYWACSSGYLEMAEFLIKMGVEINIQERGSQTPLSIAVWHKHTDLVKLLISSGAKINIENRILILDAALYSTKEIFNLLIEAGSNINIEKNILDKSLNNFHFGYSKLDLLKKLENYKLIIKLGANINYQDENTSNWTPLMNAIKYKAKDYVEYLIKNGANLDIKDDQGNTALNIAESYKNNDITNLIKTLKNEINEKVTKYKNLLFEAIKNNNYAQVKDLVKKITLSIYDDQNNNPLHIASFSSPEIIKLILSIKPSLIGEKNKAGKTPLELNPAIANYLLAGLQENKFEEDLSNLNIEDTKK